MEQYFQHVDRAFAWVITVWVPLSIVVNFVIDRVICVPADSSPAWPEWLAAHPRSGGLVKLWRGLGVDSIKFAQGVWIGLTKNTAVDPSRAKQ